MLFYCFCNNRLRQAAIIASEKSSRNHLLAVAGLLLICREIEKKVAASTHVTGFRVSQDLEEADQQKVQRGPVIAGGY